MCVTRCDFIETFNGHKMREASMLGIMGYISKQFNKSKGVTKFRRSV